MPGRPLRQLRLREERERAERGEPAPQPKLPPPPPPKAKPKAKPKPERQHVIAGAHGDPLAIFREGLALARRAGMPWERAYSPTRAVALSVESDKREREQWTAALDATLSAWRAAYERRHTNCAL
jgi:hypothetical protein